MSAEVLRQVARLIREREDAPFMLAVADWLTASAGWIGGPRHDAALAVANAYPRRRAREGRVSVYTDADRMREVAQIRSEFVDAFTTQRVDHREGDFTTEQIREWENEAYAMWRARHPALSGLLPTHLPEEER